MRLTWRKRNHATLRIAAHGQRRLSEELAKLKNAKSFGSGLSADPELSEEEVETAKNIVRADFNGTFAF